MTRLPCTCSPTVRQCPACAAEAPPKARPPRQRYPTSLHLAVRTAMQPPGSWHRASEVAQAVGRRVEQVYNLLRHWDEQGVVTRKDTGRRYQYALKKKE